jgi:hypothetical protein
MKEEKPDILRRAIRKQEAGRGTTNTEKRALADFQKGKIGIDHFAQIQSTPLRANQGGGGELADEGRKQLAIEDIAGLAAALRNPGSDLEVRVAALETLLSGLSRRSISVCEDGTAKTMTVVSTAPA